jgi:hypothetical protein
VKGAPLLDYDTPTPLRRLIRAAQVVIEAGVIRETSRGAGARVVRRPCGACAANRL